MDNLLGYAFFFIAIYVNSGSNGEQQLENLHCESRPAVVPTESHLYPYYVSLNRCNGSFLLSPPALVKCVPAAEETINVKIYDTVRKTRGSYLLKNHTKCKPACVAKESECLKPNVFRNCRCVCPHYRPPANVNCGPIKSWSSTSCSCVCNKWTSCPSRRYFDQKTCSCKCKPKRKEKCESEGGIFKYENCGCKRNKVGKSTKKEGLLENNLPFWISIFFAEFIIMMLMFEAYLYYKNHGIVYALSNRCYRKPIACPGNLGKENTHQMSSEVIYFSTDDILACTEKLNLK